MNIRYRVELSQAERDELNTLLNGGKHAARKLKRAQILLAADAGASDEEIARVVAVGGSTVYRTKRRFVEGNLQRALSEEPRPGAERKLTGKQEALLVATACARSSGSVRGRSGASLTGGSFRGASFPNTSPPGGRQHPSGDQVDRRHRARVSRPTVVRLAIRHTEGHHYSEELRAPGNRDRRRVPVRLPGSRL